MNYIFWLATFIWIPTFILWYKNFALLWKYWRTFAYAMFFAVLFSYPWDVLAVKNDIWFFPQRGNLNIYIAELPLEEYLFMITVTLFVATVTVIFKYK